MKTGIIIFSILTFLTAQQNNAYADDSNPETNTISLKGGDKAPFDGLLFSHLAAARMKAFIETQQKLSDIEKEKIKAELRLDYETDLNRLRITSEHTISSLESELDFKEQLLDDMQEQLDKNESFFNSYKFGLAVGIVGTLVVVVATGYALGQINE